jgi:hypothetical protein
MMKKVKITVMLLGLTCNAFSQVDIKVEGLSEEIKKVFEAKVSTTLTGRLEGLGIPKSIYPMNLSISYENESGTILLKAPYNKEIIDDKTLGKSIGRSFRIMVPYRIIGALAIYQYDVVMATKKSEIRTFDKGVRFTKTNKDWIIFWAGSNGLYNNVFFSVEGEEYEAESMDYNALSRGFTFVIGETKGLDGKPNSNYFLCKFFGINP